MSACNCANTDPSTTSIRPYGSKMIVGVAPTPPGSTLKPNSLADAEFRSELDWQQQRRRQSARQQGAPQQQYAIMKHNTANMTTRAAAPWLGCPGGEGGPGPEDPVPGVVPIVSENKLIYFNFFF